MVVEDISAINISKLLCPICKREARWKHVRTRTQRLIWDKPEDYIVLPLPVFSFHCDFCGSHGSETLTTDLTIGKTDLSYHYLFSLFRLTSDHNLDHVALDNRLYEKLSEDSLKRWRNRFRDDTEVIRDICPGVTKKDLLFEKTSFTDFFRTFFTYQHRFFMHEVPVNMILTADSMGSGTFFEVFSKYV